MPRNVAGKRSFTVEADLPIDDSVLRVAIVQLEGPLPAGKLSSVSASGRETFSWVSIDDVNRRTEKAVAVAEYVKRAHPKIDIIVFPEYSLPIELSLDRLRQACEDLQTIIIPGADSFKGRGRRVHNKCAVLVPGHETYWITKRNLSKWEEGKIDRPPDTSSCAFKWSHQGKVYHLHISVCLDFVTTTRDAAQMPDDTVIHVVPMCSPDMRTFRECADLMLWEPGGRAVVLCNSTGMGAAGESSLYALSPIGDRGRPLVSLSGHGEEIAVFELHCDRLVPPRRTGKEPKVPIGRVYLYQIRTSGDRVEILPMRDEEPQNIARGVLNPALFAFLGKQLRVTFLGVEGYGNFSADAFENKAFELYSVLGHHDIMVTHLHHGASALLYDVNESLAWKLRTGLRADPPGAVSEHTLQQFPYFEVSAFHKVLGVPVPSEAAAAFFLHPPSPEERNNLLDLGMDWEASTVDTTFRDTARKKGWILDITRRDPGAIDAVMTVYLDYPSEIEEPLAAFDSQVLPHLVDDPTVTSLFAGNGQRMNVHYLLRISAPRERLFAFIQRVHKAAETANLVIATTTYVIVAKWSRLSLRESLMLPLLPADREALRDRRIVPRLTAQLRAVLINRPADEQLEIISTAEKLLLAWDRLVLWNLTPDQEQVEKDLMVGLVSEKHLDKLGELCHVFLGATEDWAGEVITHLTDDDFEVIKESVGVPGQKERHQLMLPEKFKVVAGLWKLGRLREDTPLQLIVNEEIGRVRNAIAHRDFARVGRKAIIDTIIRCSEFLAWWASNGGGQVRLATA